MAATKAGQLAAAAALLECGADAWRGDNSGATALHWAAWLGQDPCLRLLLAHAEQRELASCHAAAAAAAAQPAGSSAASPVSTSVR
jgi:ankyrin repeat protein